MMSKTENCTSETHWVCRHLLRGATDIPKRCLLNYECRHCGFDQWLEEMDRAGVMQSADWVETVAA